MGHLPMLHFQEWLSAREPTESGRQVNMPIARSHFTLKQPCGLGVTSIPQRGRQRPQAPTIPRRALRNLRLWEEGRPTSLDSERELSTGDPDSEPMLSHLVPVSFHCMTFRDYFCGNKWSAPFPITSSSPPSVIYSLANPGSNTTVVLLEISKNKTKTREYSTPQEQAMAWVGECPQHGTMQALAAPRVARSVWPPWSPGETL